MQHATADATITARSQRLRRLMRAGPWISLVLVVMLVQLAGVLALNYAVDPRAEFAPDSFEPIVMNARELKTRTYLTMETRPETIVFGSSRAMTLMPGLFEEAGYGPGYNFAVNSGKITDALAIYKIAVDAGSPPAHMVLLTEDWSFRSPRQTEWPAADIPDGDGLVLAKRLLATARSDYVRDSFHSIDLHVRGFPLRDAVFQKDGSAVWERTDHAIATGTFDRSKGFEHLRGYAAEFYRQGFIPPEEEYVVAFHTLLAATRENGTDVLFVMPPMTAEARTYVNATIYPLALDATRDLLLSSCGPGVRVMDFSDAASFGATADDFTDGYHPTRDGGAKLTRAIIAGEDLCQQEL